MAGTVKAFNLPIEYVLYDLSYTNLTLYGASLPTYKSPKDKEQQDYIDGSDPRNVDKVNAFIDSLN